MRAVPPPPDRIDAPNVDASIPSLSEADSISAPIQAAEPEAIDVPGFTILEQIGQGGMGVVYHALQHATQREVALKIVGNRAFASPRAAKRFEREVHLASRLAHPNIATVYDSGLEQGIWFYAMELIDGKPIDQHVGARPRDPRRIVEMFLKVCAAISHAHQRGVLHRDLKPSNILVSADGEPHVLDFGLAKSIDGEAAAPSLSVEGGFTGTLRYASPEQVAGGDDIDLRSDVYTLGVVLYELLTGRLPHAEGKCRVELQNRIVRGEYVRPRQQRRDLDRDLEAILIRAMAPRRDERYQSVAAVIDDLYAWLVGDPVSARRLTMGYVLRKRLRKHARAIAVVACVVAIVAGVAVAAFHVVHEAQRQSRVAVQQSQSKAVAAVISDVQGKIKRGEYIEAQRTLRTIPPEHRHWEWHRLRYLTDQSLHRWDHGVERIAAVAADEADGRVMILATDGVLHSWSLTDPEVSHEMQRLPISPIRRAALDPQRRHVAVIDDRETIHMIDWPSDGAMVVRWSRPIDQAVAIRLGPTSLTVVRNTAAPRVLDRRTGEPMAVADGLGPADSLIEVSAGHWKLFVDHRIVTVRDADDRKRIETDVSVEGVRDVAIAPEDNLILVLGADGSLTGARLDSGQVLWTRRFTDDVPLTIAVGADGFGMLIGGERMAIEVVRIEDGETLARLVGHEHPPRSVLPVGNSRRLVTVDRKSVYVWRADRSDTGVTVLVSPPPNTQLTSIPNLAVAEGGDLILTMHEGTLTTLQLSTGGIDRQALPWLNAVDLTASAEGDRVVVINADNEVVTAALGDHVEFESLGRSATFGGIACNPDGRLVALARDHQIRIVDLTSGVDLVAPFPGYPPLAWSPHGLHYVGVTAEGAPHAVMRWREVLGACEKLIEFAGAPPLDLAAAADVDRFAVLQKGASSTESMGTLRLR